MGAASEMFFDVASLMIVVVGGFYPVSTDTFE
jgi:hypothetical protein